MTTIACLVIAMQACTTANAQTPSPAPATATATAAPSVERFQAWNVICRAMQGQPACTLTESLNWKENNRVAVQFEMRLTGRDQAFAVLTVPFGVTLATGVTMQIDRQAPWAPIAYYTCLPQGCIALMNLDVAKLTTLRHGQSLNVTVPLAGNGGGKTEYALPLTGFDAAYARLASLVAAK